MDRYQISLLLYAYEPIGVLFFRTEREGIAYFFTDAKNTICSLASAGYIEWLQNRSCFKN
jgi:hypothetical protein